MTDARPN